MTDFVISMLMLLMSTPEDTKRGQGDQVLHKLGSWTEAELCFI